MTKNMTKKGLALGSAAALIAAGFAGVAPAYAAFATLDASFGTSGVTQNGLLGQTFNMKATSDTTASAKFYVTGANAAELTVLSRSVLDVTVAAAPDDETTYATVDGIYKVDRTDGNDKAATVIPRTNGVFATPTTTRWDDATISQMLWSLNGVTETRTITITPFLDTVVADGKITAGETVGSPVTLTFHKASEVTATTTLSPVIAGAASLKALVALDKGINTASIGAGVKVFFGKDGTFALGNDSTSLVAATYVAADSSLVATLTVPVAANSVYTAQARVGGDLAANNSGAAAISGASAGKIAALNGLAVDQGTSYIEVIATAGVVRSGSGTIVVSTEASTAAKAVVGEMVTFTISEVTAGTLDVGATITAGGKTLSAAAAAIQKITVDVVTDADGYAELAISYAGVKDTNTFTVTNSAFSAAGNSTGGTTVTFTGEDSEAVSIVDLNNLGGAAGDSSVTAATVGGPINVSYRLVDQFGQVPAGTFRLKVATAAAGGVINSTLPVSSGSATLSISDNSDAVGTYNAVATVEKQNATTLAYALVAGTNVTSTIRIVSALPAGTRVTLTETLDSTATTNLNPLSASALATVDSRLSLESQALPTVVAANRVLSGVVFGANGAPQAGATVTLAAANVMFVTNAPGAGHYSLGSTTIKTDANGAFGNVTVLSTVAGKHTVTVTSGSGTATEDVFFAAAAATAGSKVTITAPASVQAGSTLQISAVVTDKFGNAVDTSLDGVLATGATVAVTYTGPGLIVGTLPTETNASGMLNFNVLMGSNDKGNFVPTITYLKTGSGTLAADKLSASATVIVGTVGNVSDLSAWTSLKPDNQVKVYVKNVIGAGKVQIMVNGEEIAWTRAMSITNIDGASLRNAGGAYYLVRTVTLETGSKTAIEIYVDGKRETRSAYTGK
jgi:hypothetical protein